jgi:hypothetical protein
LFFRDPDDPKTWIAQALERDIAASGPDIASAKRAFECTVSGYLQLSAQQHIEPLASLRPAPGIFWEFWNKGAPEAPPSERLPSIPAFMIPVVTYDAVQAR